MYQQDWLDELRWGAVVVGAMLALALQVLATFLVLRPFGLLEGWFAVAIVEVCIAAGAFVAGWRAERAALINGLIAALVGAAVSLAATALRTPQQLSLINILFLFGTFAAMGVLGGFAANLARSRVVSR